MLGTKNIFFNNFLNSQEQKLIDDLVSESIGIYGTQVYYIPRSLVAYNNFFGEDPLSEYSSGFMIEMYVRNVNGFGGNGDILSKFVGVQILDSMTLTVSKSRFEQEISAFINLFRAREGDLIYFPLNKKVFVVKFVEHEAVFYQMGALQSFDLQCDLWEYSNEILNTGIPEIDQLQTTYSFASTLYDMLTENQYIITDEAGFPLVQEEFDFTTQVGPSLTNTNDIIEQANDIIEDNVNALGIIQLEIE